MPDLSVEAVRHQWASEDLRAFHVLMSMERQEDWTLDGTQVVEQAIQEFGERAEKSTGIAYAGGVSKELIYVMAYMKSTRALRLLKWLDTRAPGVGLRLVQQSVDIINKKDDNEHAQVMVERLRILKKISVLSRVFSTSRIQFILKALEN